MPTSDPPDLLEALADAPAAKQGPGRWSASGVGVRCPDGLRTVGPVDVLLLVRDLLDEVRRRFLGVEVAGGALGRHRVRPGSSNRRTPARSDTVSSGPIGDTGVSRRRPL